ncbi:MAG: hypothetical protein M1817_002499 [Caeruleum heppii]|nr:MAG: hypothetical protein M1817_002499 [Caeruleum heppii]
MSTSTSVNVLRYSALVAGVVYGFYHQSTLTAQKKINQIDRDYARKESLIAKAKAAYVKKTMPAESKTQGGGDPMDSKFDLEAYLTMKMADEAK